VLATKSFNYDNPGAVRVVATMAARVSVILPVRDGGRFIAAAVDSVLTQTLSALELIAADDGSTDGTLSVLATYASRDRRIRVVRRPAAGIASALEAGCAIASAPLLARMDADDVAEPDRLARQVDHLDRHPAVAVVGSAVTYVGADNEVIKVGRVPADDATIREQLTREAVFFHPTVVLRRAAYEAVGGYRTVAEPCEDLDLWLRLAERFELANLDEPLLRYRVHPGQVTARDAATAAAAVLAVRRAAARRAAGGPDPLAGRRRLDRETLDALGITPTDAAYEQVGVLVTAAVKMTQAGCPAAAAQRWDEALRIARAHPRRTELVSAVLRARDTRGDRATHRSWADRLVSGPLSRRPAPGRRA
jgi:hypothetical protein